MYVASVNIIAARVNQMAEEIRGVPADRIAAVRRFNRFHTRILGALNEGLLASPFTLAQSRLLFEMAQEDGIAAGELARRLEMDPGYVSRLIAGFEADGLVVRAPSDGNAKRLALTLTEAGRAAFARLDAASAKEVADLLAPLAEPDQRRLVGAMAQIQRLLGDVLPGPAFVLRDPVPGDMGWVVHRQAALYTAEYGWDGTFEALVSEIVAGFITHHDPARERCWIAERDGEVVGSVFCVRKDDTVAKLRMLYVEASARGLGLGRHLVDECIAFARAKGYRRLTLWTNSILTAACRIYETAGFRLTEEEPHHSFGHDLVGQTWDLDL